MSEIVTFIAGVFVGALLVALVVLALVDRNQSHYFEDGEDLEEELCYGNQGYLRPHEDCLIEGIKHGPHTIGKVKGYE